jgi:transposase
MFDWAQYQRSKGAVKLHLVLDHDGYLPKFAVVTDGKTHEIEVARQMEFEPGTILVFDRGYVDYTWWLNLSRRKVFFVTRLKDNADYGVVEDRPVPSSSNIVRDEVVLLTAIQEAGPVAQMRRIEVRVGGKEGEEETLVFFTNHLKLAASTIAAIYRDRWQIETFFRAIKQSLRIKTFVGISANAVMIQIWTALIAMLLLRYLQLRATYGWSLSNLVALLRQQLFVYRDLMLWLNEPFQPPPDLNPQLVLPFAQSGQHA